MLPRSIQNSETQCETHEPRQHLHPNIIYGLISITIRFCHVEKNSYLHLFKVSAQQQIENVQKQEETNSNPLNYGQRVKSQLSRNGKDSISFKCPVSSD